MSLNEKQQLAFDTVLAPEADRIVILKGAAASKVYLKQNRCILY